MSILTLYQNFGIDVAPEGHKHHRPGWVNIQCPYCASPGSDGFHLGYNLEGAYYYCWRCGPHWIKEALSKLLKLNYNQVDELLEQYKLRQRSRALDSLAASKAVKIGKKRFRHPSDVAPLNNSQRKYICRRGFEPEYLTYTWGLLGTGPTSSLDGISYKFRILLPILWNGREVSFQARDYTGKQSIKYMACPEEREIAHHKHILYGHPDLWAQRKGIVVEGAFDVWRFKKHACGTLGTGYTPEQVRLLAKTFDKLVIMFDPEPIAQMRAKKLQAELSFRGVETIVYDQLPSDPGDLPQDDADHILKELKL